MNAEGKLKTGDGVDLFWQSWQPAEAIGVIVLIHGLADHGGRYLGTGQYLASHGWVVYACDLRGHGLSSDGHQAGRVHVDTYSDYAQDVSATIALAKQGYPDLPLVILGHSMGGLVSLTYALNHPYELDALVLSSPALGAHPDTQLPSILDLLLRFLVHIRPRLLFSSDLDSNAICRDPEVVQAYINDPLVSDKVSARWYVEITRAIRDIQGRASELGIPTLLMQSGDDHLIDPQAAQRWSRHAPPDLLKLVIWDGLYHEMFNEPEKDKVHACVLEWLTQQFPQTRP